jgi:hypothetical protein
MSDSLVRSVRWLLAISSLIASSCALVDRAHRPLWIVDERQHVGAAPGASCPSGSPILGQLAYSRLSVFHDRRVSLEVAEQTVCRDTTDNVWWEEPKVPRVGSRTFRYRLPDKEFDQIKALLESPSVKELATFANAGPGVGDFKLAIDRSSRTQNVIVIGLMPNHYSLQQDPALLHVI